MKVIVLQKERMILDLVVRFLDEKYSGSIVGTIDPEEALKILRQEQKRERDVVLITCHYPKTMRDALTIARLVKKDSARSSRLYVLGNTGSQHREFGFN